MSDRLGTALMYCCAMVAVLFSGGCANLTEQNQALLAENERLGAQVVELKHGLDNVHLYHGLRSGDVRVVIGKSTYEFKGVCPPQKAL